MTLIFSGNDYKYELEGVMKLFIPATLFTHVFSDSIDTEDDYVFAQKKDNADNVCLSVKVRYDGMAYSPGRDSPDRGGRWLSRHGLSRCVQSLPDLFTAHDQLTERQHKIRFQGKRTIILGVVEVDVQRIHIVLAGGRKFDDLPMQPLDQRIILGFWV